MKIYKITIDNSPGAWKQGEDPHVYVIAKNKDKAIQKVKDGWGCKWEYDHTKNEGIPVLTYMQNPPDNRISVRKTSVLSAMEIRFDGYDVHIKSPRQAKLDKIEKNIKRETIKKENEK